VYLRRLYMKIICSFSIFCYGFLITPPNLEFQINFAAMQEVLFYEDGEPKVDGESGDLKVR
jgi:hypothetical protein